LFHWNGADGKLKYQFTGKEWNDDFGLGWNDYGARFYDPALGRWHSVDPLAELAVDKTPYHYCSNDPVNRVDPDGMRDKDGKRDRTYEYEGEKKVPLKNPFLTEEEMLAITNSTTPDHDPKPYSETDDGWKKAPGPNTNFAFKGESPKYLVALAGYQGTGMVVGAGAPSGLSSVEQTYDFVFNSTGLYVRADANTSGLNQLVIESNNCARSYYSFADPVNDPLDIMEGRIKQVILVSTEQIKTMLSEQGVFTDYNPWGFPLTTFASRSVGGGKFDFSGSVITYFLEKVSVSQDDLGGPSPALFIPEGDFVAHNHSNFGNFLVGAAGYTWYLNYDNLSAGGHINSYMMPKRNGYPSQRDSDDDQYSIKLGVFYSYNHQFRSLLKRPRPW
jgi:RHS repeat-associated protein